MKGPAAFMAPRPQATGARLHGTFVGKVIDNAPGGATPHLVELMIPALDASLAMPLARVLTPFAAAGAGYVWWPAVDEQVLVTFIDGRVEMPVVIGSLWHPENKPPEPAADAPKHAVLRTKGGLRLIFDDDAERIVLVHSDGETALLLDDKTVILQSKKDIAIEAAAGVVGIAAKEVAVSGADAVVYKGTTSATVAGAKTTIGGGGLALSGMLQLNPAGAAALSPATPKGVVSPVSPGKLKK
ncbi:MAG: hypothetical protein IPL79_07920 [Myxococcales bacterium]|nr:hypothetical protein [Myxococcales bacterium]